VLERLRLEHVSIAAARVQQHVDHPGVIVVGIIVYVCRVDGHFNRWIGCHDH
jgi:hypothetical protein